MSTSPEAKAVKRVWPVVGTNSTAIGSPRTAAATARHTPTSKPSHSPLASGAAKPTRPVDTPQFNVPRDLTSSSVPAAAAPAARPAMVTAPRSTDLFIRYLFLSFPQREQWGDLFHRVRWVGNDASLKNPRDLGTVKGIIDRRQGDAEDKPCISGVFKVT